MASMWQDHYVFGPVMLPNAINQFFSGWTRGEFEDGDDREGELLLLFFW